MTKLAASGLSGSLPCPCGTCLPIRTRTVGIGPELAESVAAAAGNRPVDVIGDPNTLAACGGALAAALDRKGIRTRIRDSGPLHAGQEEVDRTAAWLDPDRLPVAVGSGTVNDVVKAAAHSRAIPYVAVATAASMNGYTSAIAAITVDGLKRTLPSSPPFAVFADPGVLASAPGNMAVSGLADLLSKPVSAADWRLSHILWGDPYCPAPSDLAESAVAAAARQATGIRTADPNAVAVLFDALLVSGFSMACAGSSSPASGGEHLISHYLDMTAAFEPDGPRAPALHGEQVGVATGTTTRMYRRLLERTPDWTRAVCSAATPETVSEHLASIPWIPVSLRDLFLAGSLAKLDRIGPPEIRIEMIRNSWNRLQQDLAGNLEVAERYQGLLGSIAAPSTPQQLGVLRERYVEACRLARWVRNRYTILDLAGDLGME